MNTILSKNAYGEIQMTLDRDLGLAMLAILSYLDSDGSVSILSCPRQDGEEWQITLNAQGQSQVRERFLA